MSENPIETKTDLELVTDPDNKLALRETPSEIKELNKKLMFEDYVSGLTLKEVAAKFGVSDRTVLRYSKDGGWVKEKEVRLAEIKEAEIVANKDVLVEETIDRTLRTLYKMASDLEVATFLGKEPQVNYKSLVDAIDKMTRLKMHHKAGGKTEHTVNVKKQTLDWNKLIEMSVKAKKEQGDAFDEKNFLKNVIDAEVVKDG